MKVKAFVFVGIVTLLLGFTLESRSLKIPLYFMASSILFYSGINQLKKARRLQNEFKTAERK
jgi:hypothetical protein